MGMASKPEFVKWNTKKESAMQRAVRTTCDLLGPRGDQQSGCRAEWISYLAGKKSFLTSFKGNRFNCLFNNAASVLFHLKDICNFLNEGFTSNQNLLVKAVQAELASSPIIAGIRATAILGKQLTEPLAKVITDNSVPVTDINNYFIPMVQRLKQLSSDASDLMLQDFEPFSPTHPQVHDDVYNSLYEDYSEEVQKLTKQAIEAMCTSFIQVATRQLKDHLPGGLYENTSEILLQETKSVRKHNLFGENDFGHLDYSQRQKPNASTKHHSSIIMTKIIPGTTTKITQNSKMKSTCTSEKIQTMV